jgi:hypothetical protein
MLFLRVTLDLLSLPIFKADGRWALVSGFSSGLGAKPSSLASFSNREEPWQIVWHRFLEFGFLCRPARRVLSPTRVLPGLYDKAPD